MDSIVHKKKNRNLIIIGIIIISVISGGLLYKFIFGNQLGINDLSKDERYAIIQSEKFVSDLFNKNDNVVLVTTGDVRRNIEKNIEQLKEYKLLNVDSSVEFINDRFATVYTIAEYEIQNDIDVSFYRFYLIKENNEFLIYKLEENTTYDNDKLIAVKDMNIVNSDVFEPIDSYIRDLADGNFAESSIHLIGNAKYNHNLSYEFISQAKDQIKFKIDSINHEIIASTTNGICLVKSSYKNNGNEVSIISSLYQTSRGWKIYDITQI